MLNIIEFIKDLVKKTDNYMWKFNNYYMLLFKIKIIIFT